MPPNAASSAHLPLAWITGAGGLIGHHLVSLAPRLLPGWQVRGLTRRDVDLLDFASVRDRFLQDRPAALIHCAATSRSPVCEQHPALARRNNVEATARLLDLASSIPFIFFSTDLVFDGRKGGYTEEDSPNPLSVYAETKVAAEEIVRQHPRHTIVRISLTGGRSPSGDRGFNEEMEKAWAEGKTLNLFTDEFRCPLPAPVVARAVCELLQREATGIYHLNGAEKMSRYEIGQVLAERHPELNPAIIPGTRMDYQGPPRPADTSLKTDKIQALLSFRIPGLSEWLTNHPHESF